MPRSYTLFLVVMTVENNKAVLRLQTATNSNSDNTNLYWGLNRCQSILFYFIFLIFLGGSAHGMWKLVTQFVSGGAMDLNPGNLFLEPTLLTILTFHCSVFTLYSSSSSLKLEAWLSHGVP